MTNNRKPHAVSKKTSPAFLPLTLLLLLAFGAVSLIAQNYGYHKPKVRRTAATADQIESGQLERGSETPARWRETRRETGEGEVRTRVLEGLDPEGNYQPTLETEEEIIKQGGRTTRVIRRLYSTAPDGRRQVVQVSEEDHAELPGGGERVVRTISDVDVQGRLNVVREETEETRQLSAGKSETHTMVRQPDINGGFRAVRQVRRIEDETAPGVVNIKSTQLLPDGNGRWQTQEVREQVIQTGESETRVEEDVYRRDANLKLSPAERTVTREWTDKQGQERRTVEVFSDMIGATGRYSDGRLLLDRRTETTTRTLPDGSQETVHEISTRPPTAPSSRLQVSERVIQFSRPTGAGEVKTNTRVEARDVNGRYVTFVNLETTAKEEKEKEKEEKQKENKEE